MREYKVIHESIRFRQLEFHSAKPERFEKEINELAKDGWVVKFSNIAVVPDEPAKTMGNKCVEPSISFYALLERDSKK